MGGRAGKVFVGTCPTTGKRMYSDKKHAKNAMNETGSGLSTFRCEHCGYWHLGHRGILTREQHRASGK